MNRPQLDAPIVPFTVRAWFRVRGAIGIFTEGEWTVPAVTAEDAQAIWLARYGERFELHHFSRIAREAAPAIVHRYDFRGQALCGSSNREDGDAPASHEAAEVTCPACRQRQGGAR